MNQLDFKGRHAVITGGATGLGYGIAQRLLASGGSVTLWDRDGEAADQGRAGARRQGASRVAVDVTQQPSVAKAVAATLAHAPAHRRAGQQRRHHRPQHQALGLPGGRLARR